MANPKQIHCSGCGKYIDKGSKCCRPRTDEERLAANRAAQKRYCEHHKEAVRERKSRWWFANKEREAPKKRRQKLRREFGIAPEDYDRVFQEQGGRCAICRTDEPGKGRRFFHVDHDHSTSLFRGLLCVRCNTALGGFKDSIENLGAAIRYLKR